MRENCDFHSTGTVCTFLAQETILIEASTKQLKQHYRPTCNPYLITATSTRLPESLYYTRWQM